MKVLVGAIGTSNYEGVKYKFDGEEIEARYFMVALAKKIKADRILVLMTEDAKTLQWEYKDGSGLKDEFTRSGLEAIPIDIPKGLSEEEAWEIFTIAAENIPHDAEVVLDVTHGLRSIPFLLLLSINYLKSVKNARIVDIFYGALEGTDRNNPLKPAYSLGEFVKLLEWSVGVENFERSGDLEKLADLLEERQTTVRHKASNANALPSKLKSVARWLRKLSVALDLTRPDEVMETSARLIKEIQEAETEFPTWAKPFSMLLSRINESFMPLSLAKARDSKNLADNIERQRKLIRWYKEKGRYQSAIIMLKEWYVSWKMYQQIPESGVFDTRTRENFEKQAYADPAIDNQDSVLRELADLRNDIAHAGMRTSPANSDAIIKRFESALDKIEKLIT